MLTGFSIQNYKAFRQRASVDLRPLTIFFGFNSTGKSALMRVPAHISASVQNARERPLYLGSEAGRGASFQDIVSRGSVRPVINLRIKFRDCQAHYRIRSLPEYGREVVERLIVDRRDEPRLTIEWIPGVIAPRKPSSIYNCISGEEEFRQRILFDGLKPSLYSSERAPPALLDALSLLARNLQTAADDVHWLKALRSVPPRRESMSSGPGRVQPDGTGITQWLAQEYENDSDVHQVVSDWYRNATGHLLLIRKGSFLGSELFSIQLAPQSQPELGVDIADTGEGMGQVLPVVGLLALAMHRRLGRRPLLSIEHPELHLHSSTHPELAKLFCATAAIQRPPAIMIETHSESFLLGVQLEIAAGRLDPERVRLYWIRQEDGQASAEKIDFDEFGKPRDDNWPPGLYSETANQAREIVRARRERADT